MDDMEIQLHRTWMQLLLDWNFREVAALMLDADLHYIHDDWGNWGINVDLPPSAHLILTNDQSMRQIIVESLNTLCKGHVIDRDGNLLEEIKIHFRVKLLEPEENWKEVVRELIVQAKETNQGTITEKIFAREAKSVYLYNEMKFASQSEIRIAQELEKREVLFFPLPLAVRRDTGKMYLDHREADFLVCLDGTWGILEVSYHPNRFEKDAEKDAWFKRSGVLCIQHYSAERCYSNSREIVEEFLDILSKYKK